MSPGAAGSVPPSTAFKRLPTNPRRRKVPVEQRKRVVRACNACNIRRVRCSGAQPCASCSSASRSCEYPPEQQKITIPEEAYTRLQERCSLLQRCLEEAVPSEKNREVLLSKWAKSSSPAAAHVVASSAPADDDEQEKTGDGRVLQDPDGYVRYLGESSGAAFMDRLREFVATVLPILSDKNRIPFASSEENFTSLLGRYHTHDSRLLLLPEVDPFYLPQPQDIAKLLAVFRFYAQDGTGLPFGGIHYWGNLWDLEDQARRYIQSSQSTNESRMLANLNAVLALACQYDPSLAPSWDIHPGETYFARAKFLMLNPMEDANPTNMRILCLMGHFLLGIYRRDAAYLYIGLAGRTAVIHGLHKGWMIEGQGEAGEQSKREFWNTYILDRWLSCLMGRPAMIPDEAVDVALPVDIPGSTLPPAAGIRAHISLSMIMDEIVNKLYGTTSRERSISELIPGVNNAIQKLSSWLLDLPPSLQLEEDTQSPERACLVLHMMYNQLLILCTRPLLFIVAKHTVAAKYIASKKAHSPSSHISSAKCCTEASRRNTQLCRRLLESNQAAAFSTLDFHYAFTAGIVLQLARLVPEISVKVDDDNINFLSNYLCKAGDQGNESARDCATMVIELGAVISRILIDDELQLGHLSQPISGVTPSFPSRGPFSGALPDLSDQGHLGKFRADFHLDNMDSNLLPQGQSTAYQEIYSWFQDSPL